MWKFIITWCVVLEIMLPNEPSVDKFGRKSNMVNAIYRCELEEDCNHHAVFYDSDSAWGFYNEAKRHEPTMVDTFIFFKGGSLTNITIDSAYITPKEDK